MKKKKKSNLGSLHRPRTSNVRLAGNSILSRSKTFSSCQRTSLPNYASPRLALWQNSSTPKTPRRESPCAPAINNGKRVCTLYFAVAAFVDGSLRRYRPMHTHVSCSLMALLMLSCARGTPQDHSALYCEKIVRSRLLKIIPASAAIDWQVFEMLLSRSSGHCQEPDRHDIKPPGGIIHEHLIHS